MNRGYIKAFPTINGSFAILNCHNPICPIIIILNQMKTWLTGIFLFLSSTLLLTAQTVVEMNGKLKLVGNQLSSECGNAVQLRGMSTHGLNHFPSCAKNISFTSLKNDWNCDIVRLAMYVEETNGYLTDPTTWKIKIDNYVDQIGALGMYCLIDWHILSDGDPNKNITAAKEFWTHMSNKHKGKKHVLYEICNEPNGVSWSTIKTYANTIIPLIRANDPETVIIVGTPEWSSKPKLVVDGGPITGTNAYNVMYTFHFYAATHSYLRPEIQTAAGSIPIFATEWGLSSSTGDGTININEGKLWMDIFAGNNNGNQKISWCNWSFSDKSETSAALKVGSCDNSAWTNTTESGTQVKTWISSPAKSFTACKTIPNCKSPNLGSDVSLCGISGGITLNSGLTAATNRTFTWKNGTTTIAGNGPTISVTSAGTYTVQVDSAGCSKTDNIVVSATLPTVNLGPDAELCSSSSITLDAGVSGSGITYAWTKDSKAIGTNTKTLSISQAGTYGVTISASGCTAKTDQIVITSSLPVVANDTICKGATASITATGTGPFDWYSVASGGTSIFTGATYSPKPTANTTYYVQATPGQDYKMGPISKGDGAWDIADYSTNDKQIVINALANVSLKSLDVESQSGAQTVTINITDMSNNTIIKTVSQSVSSGQTTINIGAALTSGKKYRIDAVGTTGRLYFRSQTGAIWPQTTANIATIQANDNVTWANSWTLFFNITLSTGKACSRVPVSVIVNTCSGIEEEESILNSIKIYPNPFENGFNVSLSANNGLIQKIELCDVNGRVVEVLDKNQITEQFKMGENLTNGQYFVRIMTNNKVDVKSVIKIK